MTDQEIIQKYFSTLVAKPANTKKLFAIGFIGLPGTGKTTVAKTLADSLALPLVSNDQLRRWLNQLGFEGPAPRQDLVRVISESRTEWFYQHETSVIVDADFSERRIVSEATAARNGASLLLFKTVCSRSSALSRIELRQAAQSTDEFSRGNEQSYLDGEARHAKYPVESVFATIDTDKDLELQLNEILTKLRDLRYIG